MEITWEDRKQRGSIDGQPLNEKPQLSFEYAWFLVTDETAQFVESHAEGYYNKDMSDEQRQEVIDFYYAWEPPAPEPAPEPDITEVTMRQARLALLQSDLLHLVDAAIDSLDEPDRSAARIEWEYSQAVERDRPFVQMLGAALGLDEGQIDDLFRLAVTL